MVARIKGINHMIYAGVGARETPEQVLDNMRKLGKFMAKAGHTLRSGYGPGADRAFEYGCDQGKGWKEIYLPYEGFAGHKSSLPYPDQEARLHARLFHPNWDNVSSSGWQFLARNSFQVLGPNLNNPADLMVCWTKGGKTVGGTGQAIRVAEHYRVPIFNMATMELAEISDKILEIINK